ncbi:MAG: hypothetical protein JWL73_3788 [Actinomycetia bacterium]|nr:hypothetical protein [Actinomycetes bacterium]
MHDNTILDVLGELEAKGYRGQFVPRADATVECVTCGNRCTADGTVFRELRRLEGASDPADMVAVAGLQCSFCGTLGTAVLSYGPEASAEDAAVLAALEDCRNRDA